jgi:anti-sigma B factor antagonist
MPRLRRHHLDVHARRSNGDYVVTPDGELDLFTSAELTRALREYERRAHRLVLDLSKLRFLDSAGLALLIAQHRRAQYDGTEFAIANASGDVRRVLAISGLDRVLAVA